MVKAKDWLGVGGGESPATILVVEDDAGVRHFLARVLEGGGYRCLTAAGSGQALSLGLAHAGSIDLVIADILIDCHMGGPELAAQLAVRRPGMRVLFMSGHPDHIVAHGEGRGPIWAGSPAPFLEKPFGPALALERVRFLLAQPARTRSGGIALLAEDEGQGLIPGNAGVDQFV